MVQLKHESIASSILSTLPVTAGNVSVPAGVSFPERLQISTPADNQSHGSGTLDPLNMTGALLQCVRRMFCGPRKQHVDSPTPRMPSKVSHFQFWEKTRSDIFMPLQGILRARKALHSHPSHTLRTALVTFGGFRSGLIGDQCRSGNPH